MAQSDTHAREAARIRERLTRLDAERAELEQRLAELAPAHSPARELSTRSGEVTSRSPTGDKIALFRSLFHGREDVYPKRWENARKDRGRLRTGLHQRVEARRVPQAPGALRRVLQSGLRAGHRRSD